MPTVVSMPIRRSALGAWLGALRSGWRRSLASISSTSCAACQQNRYGLMVVPSRATRPTAYLAFQVIGGTTMLFSTAGHGTWMTSTVTT